ncbi:MAG: hypothetical protein RLZZ367_553 [Bacteroidota bacterium]|jgi:hypothetical protein
MDIAKTKERLKEMIDETSSEHVLKEVRKILELSPVEPFELTQAEMNELDELLEKDERGELEYVTWAEVKNRLLERIKK